MAQDMDIFKEAAAFDEVPQTDSDSKNNHKKSNRRVSDRLLVVLIVFVAVSQVVAMFFVVKSHRIECRYIKSQRLSPLVYVGEKSSGDTDYPNAAVTNENTSAVPENTPPTTAAASVQSELVNINTASLDELMKLQGIGEKKAQAIIDYRKENGNFRTVEELTNVSGIGEKTLEKNMDIITVD